MTWPDRHMLEAMLAGTSRSPDPSTQVGACIVNKRNRIIASGYNSYPNGIRTRAFPWDREADSPLDTKYPYVVHAEKNAIYNAEGSVEGATLYVTMYPCNECAKDVIQARIKKIVYLSNPYKDTWRCQAAQKMFEHLDMPIEQHQWQNRELTLSCLQKLSDMIRSSV